MMETRGRKSAASLAVVHNVDFDSPPEPPDELKPEEAQVWRDVVGSMPKDWFIPASYALLVHYCQGVVRARVINDMRHKTNPRRDLDRYDQLCKMAERETRAINALSRAMRLTHQSRYDPISAARKTRNQAPDGSRPWECVT